MIIDSHTHVREGRGEIKDFLNAMDENHIDMAIVHPIVPGSDSLGYSDNAFVHKLVKAHPDRLMGYACVVPTDLKADYELRKAIEDYGLKGLKLHPPLQNFHLLDPRVGKVIETCIDLDIPILIHTGPIYSRNARLALSSSEPIDELAIRYPEAKFIIAHGNPLGNDPCMVSKHENVYMDTTSTFSEYITLIPKLAQMTYEWMRTDEKILFGTDANPLHTERFKSDITPLLEMDIPQESKEKLFSGNIKRLLKMD